MTDVALATRVGILYLPAVATLAAAVWRRCSGRRLAIALVGFLWVFTALVGLHAVAARAGWWHFPDSSPALQGIPIDGLLGWSLLWGALPVVASRSVPPIRWCLGLAGLDLVTMGRLDSFVTLGDAWLIGESAALSLVLLPSLCLTRWLLLRRRLVGRAILLGVGFAGLLVGVIPAIALAARHAAWPDWTWARVTVGLNLLAIPGVIGLSAVQEFVVRGRGTPLPFDAPKVLVTSGWYRYLRNPMQTAGTGLLIGLAVVLEEPGLVGAALIAVAFSIGLASWDEGGDLSRRGGSEWLRYRTAVRDWLPSRRPFRPARKAILWVATDCGPCSELGRWLAARDPIGLEIRSAGDHPTPLRRLRYQDGEALPDEGVVALARALEHLSVGWIWIASLIRLPGVASLIQRLVDASGGGPNEAVRCVAADPMTAKARGGDLSASPSRPVVPA